ncbi:MAG: substrate-binding domain-containing protein [Spirochaetales bacterium]|nr:substrate-binding domain-containing protein [Spirochaetales bacterium]
MGKKRKTKKITIGLLINQVDGGYQVPIFRSILKACEKRDCNLISYVGYAIDSELRVELFHNTIYYLINIDQLDGLLLLSGALANYTGIPAILNLIKPFRHKPIVSIGRELEDLPCVLVENKNGMKEAVNHLINIHGCRKIAFIRGPVENECAEDRFEAYKECLAENGIPFDPDRVFLGTFRPESGYAALKAFYDERKIKFDAIVSANDDMLQGVLQGMEERGKRIPNDCAIIGFDDIIEMRYKTPPVSTVLQPLEEQAQAATELLFDCIRGRKVKRKIILQSRFISRQSCGCFKPVIEDHEIFDPGIKLKSGDIQTVIMNQKAHIIRRLIDILKPFDERKTVYAEWFSRILDALIKDMNDTGSPEYMVRIVNEIFIRLIVEKHNNLELWQQAMYVLSSHILGLIKTNKQLKKATDIFMRVQILIGEMRERCSWYNRNVFVTNIWTLRDTIQSLIISFDLKKLMKEILNRMPLLNIRSCYISLYQGNVKPFTGNGWVVPAQSRLVMAYNRNGPIKLKSSESYFRTLNLLPKGIMDSEERLSLVVKPLFFWEEQIGFIIFEATSTEEMMYEILRDQISTTIKGAIMFDEQKKVKKKLESSNKELEVFAYKASHDLQEPLRMVSSFVQLLAKRYGDRLDKDANDFISFAVEGANRMRAMINALLEYSRVDTKGAPFIQFDSEDALRHVLSNLLIIIQERGAEITHESLPVIFGDKIQFIMLLQNLILNAIKFCPDKNPEIKIKCKKTRLYYHFSISDNGIGISGDFMNKLFMIFQRYHTNEKFPGTGIGLAICKRIVNRHGGRIWADSRNNSGATFHFTIPVEEGKVISAGE